MVEQKVLSIDIETYDPHLLDKGPSWCYGDGKILVVGLYDTATKRSGYIDGDGGERVKEMLFSPAVSLVGANIAYDFGWLCAAHNVKVDDTKCDLIDIAVAESFIDEHQAFSLDSLATKYLHERKKASELQRVTESLRLKGDFRKYLGDLWDFGDKAKREEYRDMIRRYVVADADQPARIWALQEKILRELGVYDVFLMTMRMVKLTVKMKQKGIRVDYDRWTHNCQEASKIHDALARQFHDKYGEVNINSPKQMGEFLNKHGVPYSWRITVRGVEPKGGKFSVKNDSFYGTKIVEHKDALKKDFPSIRVEKDKIRMYVDGRYVNRTVAQIASKGYNVIATPNIDKYLIADLRGTYPVVEALAEYKQVKDIISKFLGEKFGRFLVRHKDEWRLHGNFDAVGARRTSRLSSSKPNLQNIPSKCLLFEGTDHAVDLSRMCREVFIPEPGEVFVKLDFSGQENRLQAHFAVGANGNVVRKKYNDNPRFDEHQFVATASGLEEAHGEEIGRKYAKNVRFGLSYGMQLARMCAQFGWDADFAENLSNAVKLASPWFSETMDAVQSTVKKRGYIRTLLGRRVRLKEFDEKATQKARERWKTYPFYNYLIQGSAADQTKAAQVKCDDTKTVETMLLTVHDEGDYSLPMTKEGLKRLKEMVRIYETSVDVDVPSVCDPELGSDWAHCEGQKKDKQTKEVVETVDELWERVTSLIKAGKRPEPRVFDLKNLEEGDDDEGAD